MLEWIKAMSKLKTLFGYCYGQFDPTRIETYKFPNRTSVSDLSPTEKLRIIQITELPEEDKDKIMEELKVKYPLIKSAE